MPNPIRILQIVNIMDRAGLETMIMNHYRAINRDEIQFDFLVHRPQRGAYEDEIQELGGRVYRAPRLYPQHALSYRKYMRRFFKEHPYTVVHSHIDAMSAFPLAMAKECGVPVRIAHAHSNSFDRDFKYPMKMWARKRLLSVATNYWACSESAGAFLFGDKNLPKTRIIKNAIDLDKFLFNSDIRHAKRSQLGVYDNQIVIGHVGRFSAVKNQSFLIDLISKIRNDNIDAILVLVGDGELRNSVEERAKHLGLSNYVVFLGVRDDVAQIEQAFDLFVFPSLFEGLGMAAIEAQASGLPVLASDNVPPCSFVLNNNVRLSLDAPISRWADSAVRLARSGRAEGSFDSLKNAGYDITTSARAMSDAYLSLYAEASS